MVVRGWGQHPCRMSGVGGGGWVIFMSLLFYLFQSTLHICLVAFPVGGKFIVFLRMGGIPRPCPPPLKENSVQIIIPESFPSGMVVC